MELIVSTSSAFARKIRICLIEKKIKYEKVIDIPWNRNTITIGVNPLGKILILLLKNHKSIFDSKVVNQYLDYLKPNPPLNPRTFK